MYVVPINPSLADRDSGSGIRIRWQPIMNIMLGVSNFPMDVSDFTFEVSSGRVAHSNLFIFGMFCFGMTSMFICVWEEIRLFLGVPLYLHLYIENLLIFF